VTIKIGDMFRRGGEGRHFTRFYLQENTPCEKLLKLNRKNYLNQTLI